MLTRREAAIRSSSAEIRAFAFSYLARNRNNPSSVAAEETTAVVTTPGPSALGTSPATHGTNLEAEYGHTSRATVAAAAPVLIAHGPERFPVCACFFLTTSLRGSSSFYSSASLANFVLAAVATFVSCFAFACPC